MATVPEARTALFEQLVRDVEYWCDYATKSATATPPAGAGPDVRWAFEKVQALAKSENDRKAFEVACRDTLIGFDSFAVRLDRWRVSIGGYRPGRSGYRPGRISWSGTPRAVHGLSLEHESLA